MLAAGDTWVDAIPLVNSDGSTNVSFSIFIICYILIVSWVIAHLTMVVLLDNFIRASAAVLHDEEEKAFSKKNTEGLYSPMAPLLRMLVEDFIDEQDLSERLKNLFGVIFCI